MQTLGANNGFVNNVGRNQRVSSAGMRFLRSEIKLIQNYEIQKLGETVTLVEGSPIFFFNASLDRRLQVFQKRKGKVL